MAKLTCVLAVLTLLFLTCLSSMAEEIWRELVPDHGGISLQTYLDANNQPDAGVKAMGCWKLFDIGKRTVEGDLWSISPLGAGLSYPAFGTPEQRRFVGIGWDGELGGDDAAWYDGITIYAKTPVEF